ncbi:hypothetical protein K458DRAFT_304266 [Lentithecium fluviatile CBS 122367]|uniref:Zn(2)-C6 fungal-type domain-containing protein n=1 Tax=Lentithecium fluviatile CBS 122367 TaxID=1168545 RepID=A0A6G1J125_9PLEO|nr:hypothetical protein K458DRAFT_304266 [Lentithecium fluviatile CBS 122367]
MNALKTRKPHKKSRNGCLPCKGRHVKCDEQRPACVNCNKYGSICEYPRPKRVPSGEGNNTSPVGLDTPSSSHSLPPIADLHVNGNQEVVLNIPHLRLLHHFTTITAETLAYEPDAADVFSSYFVKVAFDNPYLLQALLALSALHLSRLEPHLRTEYVLQAEKHHHAALTQFMMEVSDINESNFQPVLAFSSTLFPYSWAISAEAGCDFDHAFESILSSVILTRRVRPMVSDPGLFNAMKESELGRIIPSDVHLVDWQNPEPPAETELVQLRKFSEVIHHVYPPDIIDAYKEAIHFLEQLFSRTAASLEPPSDAVLKQWVHHVQPRFIELLSEKQPGALIIFAHYGVILGRSRHYWYFEGVDELILRVAERFVPTEWASWLDWPKEEIRKGRTLPIGAI